MNCNSAESESNIDDQYTKSIQPRPIDFQNLFEDFFEYPQQSTSNYINDHQCVNQININDHILTEGVNKIIDLVKEELNKDKLKISEVEEKGKKTNRTINSFIQKEWSEYTNQNTKNLQNILNELTKLNGAIGTNYNYLANTVSNISQRQGNLDRKLSTILSSIHELSQNLAHVNRGNRGNYYR